MSESEIKAQNDKLSASFKKGDVASCLTLYAEDGCFLAPNAETFRGKDQIKIFLQGAMDAGLKELNLTTHELEIMGDSAIEVGAYELLAEGGVQADIGKFMVFWKKIEGSWLLYRDIINSDLPLSE